MKSAIIITVASAIAGCAAPPTPPSPAEQAYRAEIAARPVPLPATTPFDTDVERRAVYLEWYWFGYKEALGGATSRFCGTEHPLGDAQFKGHTDGNRDGINAFFKAMAARPDNGPATQPSVSTLSQHPVIGELGVPLGTVVEIRASVVAGSETGWKRHDGSYLLRVTEVDGHPLAPSRVMEFSVPGFIRANLANDAFRLYELKNGTKTGKLNSAQINELEKGYVGKQMRLVVYEVGLSSGLPHNLPDDIPAWQDRDFAFTTSLVILAERQ